MTISPMTFLCLVSTYLLTYLLVDEHAPVFAALVFIAGSVISLVLGDVMSKNPRIKIPQATYKANYEDPKNPYIVFRAEEEARREAGKWD